MQRPFGWKLQTKNGLFYLKNRSYTLSDTKFTKLSKLLKITFVSVSKKPQKFWSYYSYIRKAVNTKVNSPFHISPTVSNRKHYQATRYFQDIIAFHSIRNTQRFQNIMENEKKKLSTARKISLSLIYNYSVKFQYVSCLFGVLMLICLRFLTSWLCRINIKLQYTRRGGASMF